MISALQKVLLDETPECRKGRMFAPRDCMVGDQCWALYSKNDFEHLFVGLWCSPDIPTDYPEEVFSAIPDDTIDDYKNQKLTLEWELYGPYNYYSSGY